MTHGVVKDKVRVIGRGCVIILEPDGEINIADKVTCDGTEFCIVGIEKLSHMKTVGLTLRPNDLVQEKINIGDEIVIVREKSKSAGIPLTYKQQ